MSNTIVELMKIISDLREKNNQLREDFYKTSPSSRMHYVEESDMCRECGGSGYKLYGSTATWRGGVGGQAMTNSVCDCCWGSGSNSNPWPSWRKYEALDKKG